MRGFVTLISLLIVTATVLLLPSVTAVASDFRGHESAQCREAFDCYKCSTINVSQRAYCADPSNASMMQTVKCKDYCVKWVIIATPTENTDGPPEVHYIRTCSDELEVSFPINPVCMYETRSGKGRLCFCSKKLCNAAALPWQRAITDKLAFSALFIFLRLLSQ